MENPAVHGPIAVLPLEILIEIFACCASSDPLAPLPLRMVSKWWRAIINSSPRVWQLISLDDQAHSIPFLREQAELWSQRSIPLPIDIELRAESVDLILPMLSPLLPSVHRFRSFAVQGQREEVQKFNKGFIFTSESLNCLRIHVGQDGAEDVLGRTFVPYRHNGYMNVWLFKLPRSPLLAPLRFTSIDITEENFDGIHCEAHEILDFLTACPELERFQYTGWHDVGEPSFEPLPIASLPNLHTLQLKNTCMTRAILSSLYTPRLTNLHLAHLNVEIELRGEYHEEGDSDDDAEDFSQSPSSDHATGMGLRKLIARSHPPITVLEMDYSDMRTKDFKYVFDRLPFLQEFLIVASDMSDTVIQLLRPFVLHGEDGTMRTRLPCLQSLGLHNCQRLSGDAIVDALAARTEHADKRTADIDTLYRVAIVSCEGFKQEHALVLEESLGDRLRWS
ncbi:hypothetical protein FPV67DRAFT_770859 [Lyophyllum atratum]|nr:hypothetical protein FPV67DRAFT_770859 [Lyophyllum atratum]